MYPEEDSSSALIFPLGASIVPLLSPTSSRFSAAPSDDRNPHHLTRQEEFHEFIETRQPGPPDQR
jgi:hypothetical protein